MDGKTGRRHTDDGGSHYFFYDVSCRFLLSKPTDWALEIAQYSLLSALLGGAYAFRDDLYIRVDVITNLFPKA